MTRTAHRRVLAELLAHPRYEVIPLVGAEQTVLAHVPTEFTGFGVRYASRLLTDPVFLKRLERPR